MERAVWRRRIKEEDFLELLHVVEEIFVRFLNYLRFVCTEREREECVRVLFGLLSNSVSLCKNGLRLTN